MNVPLGLNLGDLQEVHFKQLEGVTQKPGGQANAAFGEAPKNGTGLWATGVQGPR